MASTFRPEELNVLERAAAILGVPLSSLTQNQQSNKKERAQNNGGAGLDNSFGTVSSNTGPDMEAQDGKSMIGFVGHDGGFARGGTFIYNNRMGTPDGSVGDNAFGGLQTVPALMHTRGPGMSTQNNAWSSQHATFPTTTSIVPTAFQYSPDSLINWESSPNIVPTPAKVAQNTEPGRLPGSDLITHQTPYGTFLSTTPGDFQTSQFSGPVSSKSPPGASSVTSGEENPQGQQNRPRYHSGVVQSTTTNANLSWVSNNTNAGGELEASFENLPEYQLARNKDLLEANADWSSFYVSSTAWDTVSAVPGLADSNDIANFGVSSGVEEFDGFNGANGFGDVPVDWIGSELRQSLPEDEPKIQDEISSLQDRVEQPNLDTVAFNEVQDAAEEETNASSPSHHPQTTSKSPSSATLDSQTLSANSTPAERIYVHDQSSQVIPAQPKKDKAALKALLKPRQRGSKQVKNSSSTESRIQKPRGAFSCLQERLQTSQTRHTGSCIRCSVQKIRCVPNPDDRFGDCVNCIVSKPKFDIKIGCFRWTVTDAELFRRGPTEDFHYTRRWVGKKLDEIGDIIQPKLRFVDITQDYGSSRARITVCVKEYIPQEGDVQTYTWFDGGVKKTLSVPPFALVDVNLTSEHMCLYIDRFGTTYIEDIIDESNQILWRTFEIAHRTAEVGTAEHKSLVLDTLRIWVASRLIEKPWRICGEDTLGMTAETEDKSSPYFDRIPVTPMMDYQLDQIVINYILQPLRTKVLKKLTEMIKKNVRKNWFTIHLCIFILLQNYELATLHDRWYAIRNNLVETYSNYPLLSSFHAGAKTLLAYFHYINKGFAPFYLEWTAKGNAEIAEIDREQAQFMQFISSEIQKKDANFKALKESKCYEKDLYFCSQMYDPEWAPEVTL